MAITYSWKIDTVGSLSTKDGKSDVIKYVDIFLKGVDDTEDQNTVSSYHRVPFDTSDLSSFIEFSDVTESNVFSWVESTIGTDKFDEWKQDIEKLIQEKVTPKIVNKQLSN